MADTQPNLHGKRYALYGDADQTLGFTQFLREVSEEPAHVLSTNGTDRCASKVRALLDASPYGAQCKVYPMRDLGTFSLLFIEPVQFLIGNTHGKYLERHTGTSLVRLYSLYLTVTTTTATRLGGRRIADTAGTGRRTFRSTAREHDFCVEERLQL